MRAVLPKQAFAAIEVPAKDQNLAFGVGTGLGKSGKVVRDIDNQLDAFARLDGPAVGAGLQNAGRFGVFISVFLVIHEQRGFDFLETPGAEE